MPGCKDVGPVVLGLVLFPQGKNRDFVTDWGQNKGCWTLLLGNSLAWAEGVYRLFSVPKEGPGER